MPVSSLVEVDKRRLTSRMFGKLNKDSMRLGIFTLITVTLGSGLLTLPKAISWFGWMPSVIMLVVACLCHVYSYHLISSV